MDLLREIKSKNRKLFFIFGDYQYVDEIKISIEFKNNNICVKYYNIGLDHIKIKSKIIKNNTSYYNNILSELGHNSSNTFIIDCRLFNGWFKIPYCCCSYHDNKILVIKRDSNNRVKLYEYIKFKKGIFTSQYSEAMVFSLENDLLL